MKIQLKNVVGKMVPMLFRAQPVNMWAVVCLHVSVPSSPVLWSDIMMDGASVTG